MDEKNAKTAESLTKGEELDAKKNEYIAVQTAIISFNQRYKRRGRPLRCSGQFRTAK